MKYITLFIVKYYKIGKVWLKIIYLKFEKLYKLYIEFTHLILSPIWESNQSS